MPQDLNADFLRMLPDTGPVAMINLLKFKAISADGDGSGRDAYNRYSRAVLPLIAKAGGQVLWVGGVEGVAVGKAADNDWDLVTLVQYPSRAAFLAMMTSADYAVANRHRENGVADHVILVANELFSRQGSES